MQLILNVYSFAILVFSIISGNEPYKGINQYQLMQKILQGSRPEFTNNIPNCHKKLIERCWAEDPNLRPTSL